VGTTDTKVLTLVFLKATFPFIVANIV